MITYQIDKFRTKYIWLGGIIALSSIVCSPAVLATPSCDAQPLGLAGYAFSEEGSAYPIDLQELTGMTGTNLYAYVADSGSRLSDEAVINVFDVTDPCTPTRIAISRTDDSSDEEAGGLMVYGNNAYVANDVHGFVLYDISDPFNPVRGPKRSDGSYAYAVVYDGTRYAYVTYTYTPGSELKVYDMTTFPSAPVASYDTVSGSRHATNLHINGDRLYMRTLDGVTSPGFEIVDISTPTNPLYVGSITIGQATYGNLGDVKVRGNYAYAATGHAQGLHNGGLLVIDISNENAPAIIGSVFIPDATNEIGYSAPGIALNGDYAYVTAQSGLYVFDISTPTNPIVAISPLINTSYAFPADFLPSFGGKVVLKDNFAFVTAHSARFRPVMQGGLATFKLWQTVVTVSIDIKPGNTDNCFNNNGKGVLPVAILGSATFDVTQVDSSTLSLEGMTPKQVGKNGNLLVNLVDINGDGYIDLVVHFQDEIGAILPGATSATLSGKLYAEFGGYDISGSDTICLVPNK